jgi:hypothetical protein
LPVATGIEVGFEHLQCREQGGRFPLDLPAEAVQKSPKTVDWEF